MFPGVDLLGRMSCCGETPISKAFMMFTVGNYNATMLLPGTLGCSDALDASTWLWVPRKSRPVGREAENSGTLGLLGGLPMWQCHRGHEGPWIVRPLCPIPVWFWAKLSFVSFLKSLTCCEVCCLRHQTSWVPGMILCDRSAGGRHSGQSGTLKAFSWAGFSSTVVPR